MTGELLIVEDDPHTRIGLKLYLEDYGWAVRDVSNMEDALVELGKKLPDVLITDIVMPRKADQKRAVPSESVGLELVGKVKSQWPDLGVVIFSGHEDRGDIVLDLLQKGQRGLACVLKGSSPDDLNMAIHRAHQGAVYIDPAITLSSDAPVEAVLVGLTPLERRIIDRGRRRMDSLTRRETEVAELLAAARSTEQIAADLLLSPGTVQNHVVNIYSKLGFLAEEDDTKLRRDVLVGKLWLVASLEGGA